MKLVINLALSLGMLALCVWLVWPDAHTRTLLDETLSKLTLAEFWPTLLGYLALLAATHFFRAWRWNNLLEPIGARLSPGKLLAISSVGFMAILALPGRLGEFVRPVLLRDKGRVSGAAVLGTVAVERIVDGLLVSLMVFFFCFSLRHSPYAQPWMMPVAWASLGIFLAAMTFLGFALRWPDLTVQIAVSMTMAHRFAPRLATKLEEKLHSMIGGFRVLKDKRNLVIFVGWSILYWATNGLGMWLLARGVGLDLSVGGAFATMGLIAVGITLPNSPGLVGQFHYFTTLGLSLYMAKEIAQSTGLVYAILLHGIQVVWYVAIGAIAMLTGHISFHDMFRKETPVESAPGGGEEAA